MLSLLGGHPAPGPAAALGDHPGRPWCCAGAYHIYYGPGVFGILLWAALFYWIYLAHPGSDPPDGVPFRMGLIVAFSVQATKVVGVVAVLFVGRHRGSLPPSCGWSIVSPTNPAKSSGPRLAPTQGAGLPLVRRGLRLPLAPVLPRPLAPVTRRGLRLPVARVPAAPVLSPGSGYPAWPPAPVGPGPICSCWPRFRLLRRGPRLPRPHRSCRSCWPPPASVPPILGRPCSRRSRPWRPVLPRARREPHTSPGLAPRPRRLEPVALVGRLPLDRTLSRGTECSGPGEPGRDA